MKTALKKVKGLGTAHNGVHHWWLQRLTAIALIPLVIWFSSNLICVANCNVTMDKVLKSEFSLILFGVLLITMLFHSALGVKVIIEDYVHCSVARPALVIFVNMLAWLTAVFLIFVIFKNFSAIS